MREIEDYTTEELLESKADTEDALHDSIKAGNDEWIERAQDWLDTINGELKRRKGMK